MQLKATLLTQKSRPEVHVLACYFCLVWNGKTTETILLPKREKISGWTIQMLEAQTAWCSTISSTTGGIRVNSKPAVQNMQYDLILCEEKRITKLVQKSQNSLTSRQLQEMCPWPWTLYLSCLFPDWKNCHEERVSFPWHFQVGFSAQSRAIRQDYTLSGLLSSLFNKETGEFCLIRIWITRIPG